MLIYQRVKIWEIHHPTSIPTRDECCQVGVFLFEPQWGSSRLARMWPPELLLGSKRVLVGAWATHSERMRTSNGNHFPKDRGWTWKISLKPPPSVVDRSTSSSSAATYLMIGLKTMLSPLLYGNFEGGTLISFKMCFQHSCNLVWIA